ncbi:SRPBCC domain-containing protein [Streptomyces sp. NPDC053750]|uniref:SRPBCC domain-containing protein n=1 Tax=Streptomyces sp. NPDC053750 TaxID=3365714 RepID=UPI0037D61394
MEHEVFVPVPAERLRDVLADPVRVARAVPGLQQDAGAEPVAGRLKVRVGSHSITYRGSLRVSARDDGAYAVEGAATESRGSGKVTLALTFRVADADGGCTLVVAGTATAEGRVTELSADAVTSSATRLLTRFAQNLGTAAEQRQEQQRQEQQEQKQEQPEADAEAEPRHTSVFDTEVPPSSLADTDADMAADADTEPPAEAAHARRTMIGRSAEEVDHAPPRGRYAPVPAPQTTGPATPLRWAAPAAALAVASAIVVGRALRRRH